MSAPERYVYLIYGASADRNDIADAQGLFDGSHRGWKAKAYSTAELDDFYRAFTQSAGPVLFAHVDRTTYGVIRDSAHEAGQQIDVIAVTTADIVASYLGLLTDRTALIDVSEWRRDWSDTGIRLAKLFEALCKTPQDDRCDDWNTNMPRAQQALKYHIERKVTGPAEREVLHALLEHASQNGGFGQYSSTELGALCNKTETTVNRRLCSMREKIKNVAGTDELCEQLGLRRRGRRNALASRSDRRQGIVSRRTDVDDAE